MLHMDRLKQIAFRIAFVGGVGTFFAINTVPVVLNGKIRKSKEYKEAFEEASKHPEVIKHLGVPLTGRQITVTSPETYGNNDEKMWALVPVTGPKGKGKLYYEVVKNKETKTNKLSVVELTVDEFKGCKLLIKKPE